MAAFHIVEEENQKPYTEYRIGKMYNAGLGTEQDYEMAVRWFTPAADGGNKYAQYSLGGLYYKGSGVVLNYETALHLYTQSDTQNFPYASYELAKMHRDGVGTTKNTVNADEHFKKAFVGFVALEAQSHDDKLQYRIGQMLLTGTGTGKDITKATEYFEKSTRLGKAWRRFRFYWHKSKASTWSRAYQAVSLYWKFKTALNPTKTKASFKAAWMILGRSLFALMQCRALSPNHKKSS